MFSAVWKSSINGSIYTPDPYLSNVSLLLHGDGANNGTTITDSSLNAVQFTRVNSPVTSTTQSKFGGSSIWFERATADRLTKTSATTDALFTFGTGDFTIEFWVYLNTGTSTSPQNFIDFRPTATNGVYPAIVTSGGLSWFVSTASRITGPHLAAGQWYHVAVSRVSSQTRMFVDGSQVGSTYADTNNYLLGSSTRPFIGDGAYGGGNDNPVNGYIDELRITKGVGRYAANFTPATKRFQDASGVTATPSLAFSSAVTSTTGTINLPASMAVGDIVVLVTSATNSGTVIPTEVVPSGFTTIGSQGGEGVTNYRQRIGAYVRRITTAGAQSFSYSTGDWNQFAVAYIYRGTVGPVATMNVVQNQLNFSATSPTQLDFTGTLITEPSALIMGSLIYNQDLTPSPLTPATATLIDSRMMGTGSYMRQYFAPYTTGQSTESGSIDIADGGYQTIYGTYLQLTYA